MPSVLYLSRSGCVRSLESLRFRPYGNRARLVEGLPDLGFVDVEFVKSDRIVHQNLFAIVDGYHVLERVSSAPDRLGPSGGTMRVVCGIHDLVDADFITASDTVTLVPERAPHIRAEDFTGFFRQCR